MTNISVEPAPATPIAPTALGEFRITAVLGQGGSGTVYDATWGPRRVALKVLNPNLVGTDKERAQFLGEAQRLQQIGHPSVVKVLAAGQLPDGRPYLAMERLDGETLAHMIAKGALALDLALVLFGELCGAVAALHDRGLVHRDLKPENVFIVGGRHAVLLDFGIAKDLAAPASTTTQEGNVRGTPAYMAPERFFGQPAGLATDIYELALVLYVMLAGRLPWQEVADPEARLSPRPLVELANVPEALDVEIRRALSTRAQNRPTTAAVLHGAVTAAAAGSAEPGAAETARMRSGEVEPSGPADARPPASVPDQPTPLAWAPTLAAPSTASIKSPKRWPWVAGSIAVVAAAGTFAYVRLDRNPTPPSPLPPVVAVDPGAPKVAVAAVQPSANDPWAAKPEQVVKAMPLVETQLAPAIYRGETVRALQHLPADTRVVFTAQIHELRANPSTEDMLEKLGKNAKVNMLFGGLPPCVRAIASDAEWVVFGAPSIDSAEQGTLVIRGRWRRKDVEACFAEAVKPNVANDGAKLYRLGDTGWLDFIDDHTAYATIRADLEAEAVHALVKRGTGADPHAAAIVAKLPADRSIALVIDGKAKDDWTGLLKIPKGSDVYGWIRIDPTAVSLDFAADTHDEAAAKRATADFKPQIDDLFSSSNDAVGKLVVEREQTVVHARGKLSSFMLSMISAALDR